MTFNFYIPISCLRSGGLNAQGNQIACLLYRLCAGQVPGDTYRNLRIAPAWSSQTFKHVLVPVWLLVYEYGGKAYQVVANGYTGTIAGRYPKSPWKILALVAGLAAAILAILIGVTS